MEKSKIRHIHHIFLARFIFGLISKIFLILLMYLEYVSHTRSHIDPGTICEDYSKNNLLGS